MTINICSVSSDLHLKGPDILSKFLATGFPYHRNDFYVNISNENVSEENENVSEGNSNENFKTDRRNGVFIKAVSIHKKYEMRLEALNDLRLAQFASSYNSCTKLKKINFVRNCSEEEGDLIHYQTERKLPKYPLF